MCPQTNKQKHCTYELLLYMQIHKQIHIFINYDTFLKLCSRHFPFSALLHNVRENMCLSDVHRFHFLCSISFKRVSNLNSYYVTYIFSRNHTQFDLGLRSHTIRVFLLLLMSFILCTFTCVIYIFTRECTRVSMCSHISQF